MRKRICKATTHKTIRRAEEKYQRLWREMGNSIKVGDLYYAEQFGNLEQASGKFKELKSRIRNGEKL
jgi:hypothetical protein